MATTFKLKQVLLPTDFSPASETATAVAVALARDYGAELTVLHVIEEVTLHDPSAAVITGVDGVYRQTRKIAERQLEEFLTRLPADVTAHGLVRRGAPRNLIVRTAEEREADAIVLATHGHGALHRWLVGSIAEGVVRAAHCPVMVVPARLTGAQPSPRAMAAEEDAE